MAVQAEEGYRFVRFTALAGHAPPAADGEEPGAPVGVGLAGELKSTASGTSGSSNAVTMCVLQ